MKMIEFHNFSMKDHELYVVAGHKKWITNGIWADYFTTAVRTGPVRAKHTQPISKLSIVSALFLMLHIRSVRSIMQVQGR